ncbi:histidine--tRNA ligase [Pirellula sp. SH-Sr6A]|uniref:histidine--tRNA ligase n=1 Tax=Pirellula sp. SH-Sr6A TaxID=1632865 RepID=UPI0011BAD547|nr:histidine--tRNA ligase [Pirellula sp. SH-Sr6A]
MIEPRTLKGFRDFLPESMIPREKLMETARTVYRRYGFVPIDTPALELLEVLTGKGSDETDRQMYHFTDAGGRAVGMRFDLTVPFARFAAQHIGQLGTPFKRYHIAPVWRGETPQAGRFREFVQCDFDTIGTTGVVADIETALVIHELMQTIGIERFAIRINNRQVLTAFLQSMGLEHASTSVLRALDKFEKVGGDQVRRELEQAGLNSDQASAVLELAALRGSTDEILSRLDRLVAGVELGGEGVERLRALTSALEAAGVSNEHYRIDVSIARGLDYYTGVVFETTLGDLPSIGSVCSGGRYDNLAGLYTKQHLPGIGASLGLDRLLAALEQLGRLPKHSSAADVFIALFDPTRLNDYFRLASIVRHAGYSVEVYPDGKKLAQQLKYADQRGFRVALIAGSDELERGTVQVKDLVNKIGTEVSWRDEPVKLSHAVETILRLTGDDLLA